MVVIGGIILMLCAAVLVWMGIAASIGAFRWQHRPLLVYGFGLLTFSLALLSLARAIFEQSSPRPAIWFSVLTLVSLLVFRLLGGWGSLEAQGLKLRHVLLGRRLPKD
jgi:hypothetical protein